MPFDASRDGRAMTEESALLCRLGARILDGLPPGGQVGVSEIPVPSVEGLPPGTRATRLALEDGRSFLLLRRDLGWKDNFVGVLCASDELRDHEIVRATQGPDYLSLYPAPPFEELYIKSRHHEKCLEVYFDLN
jgi:hypothetical protein